MRTATSFITAILAIAALLVAASPARAQFAQPLPVAVLDVRGFYTGLGQDTTTAGDLGLAATALPKRGLGGVAGVHLYLLRSRKVAIGLGAEGILARARATQKDANGVALALPVIEQRIEGLSGALSLNFGHRAGWSYVTAGMGPLAFSTRLVQGTVFAPAPKQMTINMGGGARWFAKKHLAFGFDFRIYQTRPEVSTLDYASRQRANLRVLSAGIAVQ